MAWPGISTGLVTQLMNAPSNVSISASENSWVMARLIGFSSIEICGS